MVWSVQAAEAGSLLEAAVRRGRVGEPESARGRRWVEGEAVGGWGTKVVFEAGCQENIKKAQVGMWAEVDLPAAAAVTNPIARLLVDQLRAHGIEVEWVQQTLERWGEDMVVVRQMSVDLVLSVAGEGGWK